MSVRSKAKTKPETKAKAKPESKPKAAPKAASKSSARAAAASRPVHKGDHVYLIDGSGYIFRAYHALPPLTRPSDGLPVGAIHGFCAMLWKLLREAKESGGPTHIAVIFDHSAKSFRNDIYADYKAHRPEAPEDLVPQFPLMREAVRAFNVACIEQEGYEADDLIATYAAQAVKAGADVTIISSDKDLMQLVGPTVVMLDTMKNRRIGEPEVIERFGVPPDKVIEVQALIGDSVDNVPGVPGIGVKTAAQLIQEYGDLETLLGRAQEIKQPKRRENLIQFADQARLSHTLCELKQDVPVAVGLDIAGVHEPVPDEILGFLHGMEFNTLTRRVAEGLGAEPPAPHEKSVGGTVTKKPGAPPKARAAAKTAGELSGPAQLVAQREAEGLATKCDRGAYETVSDLARLDDWIAAAYAQGFLAFDTETDSLDAMQATLVGVSLALSPGAACYVPLRHGKGEPTDLFDAAQEAWSAAGATGTNKQEAWSAAGATGTNKQEAWSAAGATGTNKQEARSAAGATGTNGNAGVKQIDPRAALDRLKPLLEDLSVLKIGQNLKYDMTVLAQHGIALQPLDDTMLMSYALDAGRLREHGMDGLALKHLSHTCLSFADVAGSGKSRVTFDKVPIDRATEYAAEDADVTLRLWRVLKPRLVAERVTTVYETLERPLVPVLVAMERTGVKVDRQVLSRLSGEFAQTMARLEDEIYELAGEKFNIASTRQLGEILFEKMSLPGGKTTKTGIWATDVKVLEELAAAGHDLPQKVLDWRQVSKLKSTYTDALPNYIDPNTGRVHTSYSLAATTTGRLASSEPNLQNIPVRTKEGREIRKAFIAEPGNKLISADYSQIELRVLAHMADIDSLKTAFAEGLDIHAMTASEMFGVPIEGMDPMIRRRAKAINFGIIYGISAFGLAAQLGIPRGEAADYIETYFKRFPGIRDYMESTKAIARKQGYVTTLFGRKAHYKDINAKHPSLRGFMERAAINAPIQGSAADIIRRAMIRMPAALEQADLSARMLLQVHDELVFEAPKEEVEETIKVARRVMEHSPEPALTLKVPLKVDAKAADDWEAAH